VEAAVLGSVVEVVPVALLKVRTPTWDLTEFQLPSVREGEERQPMDLPSTRLMA
jgi:hypothetical protein